MNTTFLNSCKALITSQRRAQVVGQILCLMVVAALFVLSPLAVLAGCGQNNNQEQEVQQTLRRQASKNGDTFNILATISRLDSPLVKEQINPQALNKAELEATLAKLPKGSVSIEGDIQLAPFNGGAIRPGEWIVFTQKTATGSITYAGTFFGCKQINGQNICEVWPAETPVASNTTQTPAKLVPVGRKLFVTFRNFAGGTTQAAN